MKLYKNAIILVVVIALLGGAYYFINKNKKTTPDTTQQAASNTIYLINETEDKIDQVTLENSEGIFVIVKKDKDWVLSSPTDINADSSKLSSIVINSESVIADKLVEENATDLAKYGLDKPVQVTIKLKDKTEKVLQIGNEVPTKGAYYAKLKENNKVYVIGSYTADALLVKRLDIKSKTLFTLKEEDIISISMDRGGANVFAASKDSKSNWQMSKPINGSANSSALSPMFAALVATTVSDYVEENATDLAKYGLDNPAYVFEFSTSSAKYKLMFGSEKVKDSTIYARLDGSNDVFTVSESAYTFLDKPIREIVDVFAYLVNIDQVNKIELTMDGQMTTFTLDTYKDKDGKTDNEKDKFTMNGKDVSMKDKDDKQPFRQFYQALVGIGLDEIDVGTVAMGTPDVTIKYYLKSAPGTVKIDFVSKDANYYYIFKDGQYTGMITSKAKQDFGVAGMKAAFKTLTDAANAQK